MVASSSSRWTTGSVVDDLEEVSCLVAQSFLSQQHEADSRRGSEKPAVGDSISLGICARVSAIVEQCASRGPR